MMLRTRRTSGPFAGGGGCADPRRVTAIGASHHRGSGSTPHEVRHSCLGYLLHWCLEMARGTGSTAPSSPVVARRGRHLRADAARNLHRTVEVAARLLGDDPRAGMAEVATA